MNPRASNILFLVIYRYASLFFLYLFDLFFVINKRII